MAETIHLKLWPSYRPAGWRADLRSVRWGWGSPLVESRPRCESHGKKVGNPSKQWWFGRANHRIWYWPHEKVGIWSWFVISDKWTCWSLTRLASWMRETRPTYAWGKHTLWLAIHEGTRVGICQGLPLEVAMKWDEWKIQWDLRHHPSTKSLPTTPWYPKKVEYDMVGSNIFFEQGGWFQFSCWNSDIPNK